MENFFRLDGQTVLLTGAAGGIGRASAVALAAQGAHVVLTDVGAIDPDFVASLGDRATAMRCDVTDRASVAALQEALPQVDAIVLAAGILPFDDWLDDGWDASFERVMAVNVKGGLNILRAYFPGMCERGSGRVVFVGSASGRMGGMQAGPHYAGSKGAVHTLVRWFAQRGAPRGVGVNGIAPGSIETDMLAGQPFTADRVPAGRMGRPEEIAWPIAFLCSPAASYMSGAVLDVNGGLIFS
ncbi:SDR family NAD(P)-dependent oxidoreductase [Enterovirga rhinocerotis]|uniref:3-oxoacyl-[acyl-carrier protein] reductase n=1 Tax=Enterovirga rhinocerotis TaxID=1339210 RepID=A0A4R7BZS4_9HYPH|nr:SDR family NAD(P)-dependent oxidoreductase [Enterovirga rhinocerotis]TDR89727.1 3-oxoacyl-[acyl-carrier protein] reductase [Enterovirga rhinocerotis]